ncbi:glycosidase [Longilinea arvoryzae]|uniref:Glycosidase n=1 Tax=Longilinea arvoryzae TaxID=360412 RepID=A0A0S7BJH8_9CHLR|nr:alpha-glucosidase [Longilinea arvoryzae]GAP14091.1 glycosidase [Longilinea arvoryzae]
MKSDFLWWRDGVIYQIYPRSFADSNGDGIGDLPGILSKLDYLVELGVDALWLSPIYPSPDADFGYDVADYTAIDPKYGTLEDFDRLVQAAHQRGLRIVMDLVLNHTSNQHPWFLQSRSSRDDPYHDWYIWRDAMPGRRLPNDWQSVFGGSAWEWDEAAHQYYYHMFTRQQPDLNWRNPAVRKAMLDVFRFWLDRGVDGFRLDVFNVYFKDDRLRKNPRRLGRRPFDCQVHLYDCDRPEMLPLLQEIRALLDSVPERYAVGETFLSNTPKAAGYARPGLLHAAFDFSFLECGWNPAAFLKVIQAIDSQYNDGGWPTYVLGNHDVNRIATRYTRGEDDERLKVLATLLLTQRGTPFMYQGEEIGMRNVRVPRKEMKDPVGLRYWPIPVGRDGERSPMQWTGDEKAGFSRGTPWMRVHPDVTFRNVEALRRQPDSVFHVYRRLLRLRKELPALRNGIFLPLTYEPHSLLAYLRKNGDQTLLVALNFHRKRNRLVLGSELAMSGWRLAYSTRRTELPVLHDSVLVLEPYEAIILEQQ